MQHPAIGSPRHARRIVSSPDQAPGPVWAYHADLEYMPQLVEYWRTRFDGQRRRDR